MSDRPATSSCALSPARRASAATTNAASGRSAPAMADVEVDRHRPQRRGRGGQQHALDPGRPADARRRRPAELLDQAVVASPAPDAALGAERVARELEHRARVVVEPAHERRVDLVRDVDGVEQRADGREVVAVVGVEPVEQSRRVRHHRARPGVVGVEGAQRVQLDPLAHVVGQLVLARTQVVLQLVAVRGAGGGRPERPQPQPQPADRQRVEQLGEQQDRLGVERRVVGAQRLETDLPELPVAAGLGALAAEEARQVPEPHRLGRRCMPCSTYARQTGAVPSGRRVIDRPPPSSNVYISLRTMSVASPTPRANRSVVSNTGVSIRP